MINIPKLDVVGVILGDKVCDILDYRESSTEVKDLYKLCHPLENAFLHLKRWRGIATRYAKNTASFLAAVQI